MRGGQNILTECIFKGPESRMAQGCVIYSKSKVTFKNCKIDGFFTGIVAYAGSEVLISYILFMLVFYLFFKKNLLQIEVKNCSFQNCDVAIQIYSGAKIHIDNCTFNGYSESAIRFDNNTAEEIIRGNISLLQKYEFI